jgi:hypothetical protein
MMGYEENHEPCHGRGDHIAPWWYGDMAGQVDDGGKGCGLYRRKMARVTKRVSYHTRRGVMWTGIADLGLSSVRYW